MNNKGVTLIELLIVIVVLGIISAFAIPAVGTIISNTEKDAVVADAIAVDNAAKLYCAQTTCSTTEALTYLQLSPYISSFDATQYDETDSDVGANDGNPIAEWDNTNSVWNITLTKSNGDYGWNADTPVSTDSTTNRGNVN